MSFSNSFSRRCRLLVGSRLLGWLLLALLPGVLVVVVVVAEHLRRVVLDLQYLLPFELFAAGEVVVAGLELEVHEVGFRDTKRGSVGTGSPPTAPARPRWPIEIAGVLLPASFLLRLALLLTRLLTPDPGRLVALARLLADLDAVEPGPGSGRACRRACTTCSRAWCDRAASGPDPRISNASASSRMYCSSVFRLTSRRARTFSMKTSSSLVGAACARRRVADWAPGIQGGQHQRTASAHARREKRRMQKFHGTSEGGGWLAVVDETGGGRRSSGCGSWT